MPTSHAKFSALNKVAKCRCCGRSTHSSIQGCVGIELCRACFESSSLENSHSDEHTDSPEAGCPFCDPTTPRLPCGCIDTSKY